MWQQLPVQQLLIEGAGGWLLPISSQRYLADWVAEQGLPVLLVVGMKLGCLNHAMLTVREIERSGCQLLGWVANCIDPDMAYQQENISYLQHKNLAKIEGKEYSIEENAQDLLGAFYYCRTMDFSKAKPGDIFTIPTFFDFENHNLQVKFLGKEVISTTFGNFNTLKFMPIVQEGRVFKEKEDMNIWLSDDENKVPIRLKTDLLFGHLKADLVVAKNLRKPLNRAK